MPLHAMHAGEVALFADSATANQAAPRYLVLDWLPEAFHDDHAAAAVRGAAFCSRALLEADGASRSGVACGRGGAAKISLHTCIDLFSQQAKPVQHCNPCSQAATPCSQAATPCS